MEEILNGVGDDEPPCWHWQLRNRIKTVDQLNEFFGTNLESKFNFPISITPYYAGVCKNSEALKKTVIPSLEELKCSKGESEDPLNEEEDSPIKGIVHRYPDRVLFLVSNMCSVMCRYCCRSRMVDNCLSFDYDQIENGIKYIKENECIRDVLISGGDPLVLSDEKLEWILSELRSIEHVEILRIGTKVPVVLPMRINLKLVNMLKKYHPLFMSIHFTHPDEITKEVKNACNLLADYGIPLGSQTVLLKGVNDNIDIMKSLFQKLLTLRCRPYYLYLMDMIIGGSHFRTSIEKGLEIIKSLRGFTTGYGIPTLVIDAPGGGGKIPLQPNYIDGCKDGNLVLKNYKYELCEYPLGSD